MGLPACRKTSPANSWGSHVHADQGQSSLNLVPVMSAFVVLIRHCLDRRLAIAGVFTVRHRKAGNIDRQAHVDAACLDDGHGSCLLFTADATNGERQCVHCGDVHGGFRR